MSKNNQYESDAYLDQLSMEQLEDLLRADLNSPDEENDEAIFHILEVMKKREKENPTGRLPDKNKAWKEFQEYYNIPEGEGQSLYPTYSEPENNGKNMHTLKTNESTTRPRFRMRRGIVAAAILVVMFGSMLTAQAAGLDVFGAIGRWTEETFHFEIATASEDGTTDYSFQEVSTEKGLPKNLIPTRYPKGFEPSEPIDDSVEGYVDSIYCEYTNTETNKSYLTMVSRYYDSEAVTATVYEKDSTQVETYQSKGRTFYIMSNLDSMTATWSDGKITIEIIGQLEINQIKYIIDSIGE